MSRVPMTTLRIYSEDIDGRHILHALDLPGCYAEGTTEAEALERFPAAWASHADWLAAHGEMVPERPERFAIAERFASYVLADGYEVNALFAPERRPPSRRFIALCMRLLDYSRTDLHAAWQAIPAARHDAIPADGERTPRQIIDHVARAEWWYLSHVTDPSDGPLIDHPSGSPAKLAAVRTLLLNWLSTASVEELGVMSLVYEEAWSVRKVLRRAIWHERTHTDDLARYTERGAT